MCQCDVCKDSRRYQKVIENRNVDELIKLVEELYERLAHAETDNEYYNSILEGKWPDGKEILERALAKYKENQ